MRELLKAMLKTGSGTTGTVVFGVLTAKVIAVLTGPSGIGLFSLLRQTQQTLAGIATMQGNTALVQGMSCREGASRDSYAATVAIVFITVSAALSLCIWFFAPALAGMILGRQDHEGIWLIRGLVPNVLAAAAVLYLGALLNSYREIGRLALVQVAGALGGAVAAYPLVRVVGQPWGLLFILWAIGIASLLAAIVFTWRGGWLGPLCRSLFRLWDSSSARYFFRFAGVTIIAGLMISGTVLLVRALFMHHGGMAEAGIFDVAWTLSAAYLMLLLGSLGTYYTPVLAGTMDVQKRIELMSRVFRMILLMVTPLITLIVLGKSMIVTILYSREFMPALDIIQWMLIGDYFKAIAWVLATPMLALADLRVFFWTELFWNTGMVIGAWAALFLFHETWMVGAVFLILYVIYGTFCYWYAKVRYGFRLPVREKKLWLSGLAIVVSVSILMWGEHTLNWPVSILYGGVLFAYLWLGTSRSERERLVNYGREKLNI